MRKSLLSLIVLLAGSVLLSAASITSVTNQASLNALNLELANAAKKNFGFMTGSGNVTPANTTEFLGIKVGLGAGLAGNAGFFNFISSPSAVTSIDALVSYIPAPYDIAFFKIGLPGFIPFLDKADVGVRVGYFPAMDIPLPGNGFTFKINNIFAFGAELRKTFFELPLGLIRIDARVSYNFTAGGIGLQYTTNIATVANSFTETLNWTGNSIAAKVVAGVNIPLIFSAFAGIGPDINFGGVTAASTLISTGSFTFAGTTFSTNGTFTSSQIGNYDPFDIRVIGGIRLLVIDVAAEYGLLSGGLSLYAGASLTF